MTSCPKLCVTHEPTETHSVLASFDADAMGLTHLGGNVTQELWCGPKDHFGWVEVQVADPIDQDPAATVKQAYLDLFTKARELGWAHALRIWQFIPGINEGLGDQERYRRFCVGRAEALKTLKLAEDQMCAATAIGCHDETFRLMGIFGQQKGVSVENPRQVSAWEYPRDYGPVSPAFARATAVALDGFDRRKGSAVMVSGTAAVVGHASAYPEDVRAQTEEAMTNIEAVLAEAKAGQEKTPIELNKDTYARAYVRLREDAAIVQETLAKRWPNVQAMILEGDICRSELLVEIELWHPD